MIFGNRDFRLDPVFYFPISTNDMYMHPGFFSGEEEEEEEEEEAIALLTKYR